VQLFRRRGRILAVKWGYNPNSTSLGVNVTLLLFGMAAVAFLTPLIALFLNTRRKRELPGSLRTNTWVEPTETDSVPRWPSTTWGPHAAIWTMTKPIAPARAHRDE
jgi:hypothetical protein